MATDFGSSMNQVEARIAQLEQKRVVGTSGISPVTYDAGVPVVDDLLDWSKSDGWESYTKITVATIDGTGAAYTSKYAMPAAHMTGRMCMLTGMVRRKAGAANLVAGTRYNLQMFGLPDNWRPATNVILPCVMGNSDPNSGVVGTAQIEIRTGFLPTEISGRVYYINGSLGSDANIGWIALQGSFPCKIVNVRDTVVMGSWGDAHFQESWNTVADTLTWSDYGDYFNYTP